MNLPPLELAVTHDEFYRFNYLTEVMPGCTNDHIISFVFDIDPFVAMELQRNPARGVKLIIEPT